MKNFPVFERPVGGVVPKDPKDEFQGI